MQPDEVRSVLAKQHIETPSWAYGNSGTRFKVFAQQGIPRDAFEKISDAAQVHRYTGVAPSVAIHIPWDQVDDFAKLAQHAADEGVSIGAVNPNTFQEDDYRLGSVCNPDPRIRRKAIDHLIECVQIAGEVGSKHLSLWFADGTNYPGQDSIRDRQDRLGEALKETYEAMTAASAEMTMLVEYKFFEPAFYHTDLPDWGTSLLHCLHLGPQAKVLVDTGHHAPGTNIEMIVATLLREGRLGGFHFNSRFYADDDLIVGAADPFGLFRIMFEVAQAGAVLPDGGVAFMLDQCHNLEAKIPAEIRSVMNVQEATAKALLVDAEALAQARSAGDVLAANAIVMDAYNTDVRPLLAQVREEMGLAADPLAAYAASGYAEKIVTERVGGSAAGWGA
ncbi:L-rhamnose isomerase [Nakamurella lactea]|uniref:L-rhamnose isomerase n=1 Tax=Nakamurella lactea TaxID=459515 RepID=UPI0004005F0E|nr:L-rhamnose isomerase [Nakamurella lactea]